MVKLSKMAGFLMIGALFLMVLLLLGSVRVAGGQGPPASFPDDCSDLSAAPDTCCMRGYVYPGQAPVAGARVRVESPSGVVELTTGSGPLSADPYYSVNLSITVSISAMRRCWHRPEISSPSLSLTRR